MTTTTATQPSVLLNPVVKSAKSGATTDQGGAPHAALSGFELLLGNMQQLQQKLSTQTADGDSQTSKTDKTSGDDGKVLPQLGTVLPSAALPQVKDAVKIGAAVGDDDKKIADKKSGDDKKDKKDKSDVAAIPSVVATAAAAVPEAAAVVVGPHPNGGAAKVDAAASGDSKSTAKAAAAIVAGAAKADGKAQRADSTGNKNQPGSAAPANGDGSGNSNSGNSNSAAQTAGSGAAAAAATAAADGKGQPAASKAASTSDFKALIKHVDAATPAQQSQSPVATHIGDASNLNQASRTYADAANSNASVQVPVGSPSWGAAVADKVMWFSAHKISSAEIHLNPPDLGPLQVRVSTQHNQTSVVFTSQHADVRDALGQAVPRLRDMMGSQGMQLLDVSVGGQTPQQQPQQQFGQHGSSSRRGTSAGGFFASDTVDAAPVVGVTAVNTTRLLRSGVDAYA